MANEKQGYNLLMGSTGNTVKALQAQINRLVQHNGLVIGSLLETDGVFGNKTERAVKVFQLWKGLKADGIVGPKTYAALWPDLYGEYVPPKRHKILSPAVHGTKEVLHRALAYVGQPVTYHLEAPNGGTDPEASAPYDEQTGQCDCSGFDAWVQGHDRDFYDLLSRTLGGRDKNGKKIGWDGYANTDSKIAEALTEGLVYSVIKLEDAQPGDMIIGKSYKPVDGGKRKIGHEGTITWIGDIKRDYMSAIHVVHCSPSNVKLNKNESAVWKTNAKLWLSYPEWYIIRFNREYAYNRLQELTGHAG